MKENWKIGKNPSVIVSDTKQKNNHFPVSPNKEESEDSDLEYYGGYMVCESVGSSKSANLIATAPDMLEALKDVRAMFRKQGIRKSHELFGELYQLCSTLIDKAQGIEEQKPFSLNHIFGPQNIEFMDKMDAHRRKALIEDVKRTLAKFAASEADGTIWNPLGGEPPATSIGNIDDNVTEVEFEEKSNPTKDNAAGGILGSTTIIEKLRMFSNQFDEEMRFAVLLTPIQVQYIRDFIKYTSQKISNEMQLGMCRFKIIMKGHVTGAELVDLTDMVYFTSNGTLLRTKKSTEILKLIK